MNVIPIFLYGLLLTVSWCHIFLPPMPFPFSVKLMFKNLSTTLPCESCLIQTQFTHLHIINTCNNKKNLSSNSTMFLNWGTCIPRGYVKQHTQYS